MINTAGAGWLRVPLPLMSTESAGRARQSPFKQDAMKKVFALLAVLAVSCTTGHSQAHLSFSGGSGSPLTLSLAQTITYTITNPRTSDAPLFVFEDLGNLFQNGQYIVNSTITFSRNGGEALTITTVNSGISSFDLSANDVYMYGPMAGANVGDVITLRSGSITTMSNVAAAAPSNGSYDTFVVDGQGVRLSPNGVAVPEPQSVLLGVIGLGVLLVCARRRAHSF